VFYKNAACFDLIVRMLTNSCIMVSAYLEPVYRFSWNSVWTLPLECAQIQYF